METQETKLILRAIAKQISESKKLLTVKCCKKPCYHATGKIFTSRDIYPPKRFRFHRCCNCGNYKEVTVKPIIPDGHGPFYCEDEAANS